MSTTTVTIAIPAFNEARTIRDLLLDLLKQEQECIKIVSIIVSSDGSNDNTVTLAQSVKDSRIEVISNHTRKGKAYRQNELLNKADSDVLVILDADVRVVDLKTIEALVKPIVHKNASLTSAEIYEHQPETFIESILYVSMKLKSILFSTFRNGNNIFHCHGPIRAFSKVFYKNLRFKVDTGEDMYSYLACIALNQKFCYVGNTGVLYKLPKIMKDHKKQSYRYHRAKKLMKDLFGEKLVTSEFSIPLSVYIYASMKCLPFFLKNFFMVCGYFIIFIYVRLTEHKLKREETWATLSTK